MPELENLLEMQQNEIDSKVMGFLFYFPAHF